MMVNQYIANTPNYTPRPTDAVLYTAHNNMGQYSEGAIRDLEYKRREIKRLMEFYNLDREKANKVATLRVNYLNTYGAFPPPYYPIVG